jgi:predicted  nucleic acid-binding Zn-ribbon protein
MNFTELEFYMLSVVSLVKNREGWLVSDTHRECTNCNSIYERTSRTVTLCPKCNCDRVKANETTNRMLSRAKNRAKLSGREFTITVEDIVIPEVCPIMDIPLQRHENSPGGRPNLPSLDRIDNSKGYTPDNIQVICHLANQMKAAATPREILKFADWAIKTYRNTDDK